MTLIPMPIEWSSLSAQGTRYGLMHDIYRIAHASVDKFHKEIDILEIDNFVGDLHLQDAQNYVGMILFDDEVEDINEFICRLLFISNNIKAVSVRSIQEFIDFSKQTFARMSKHGEIQIF